MGAGDGTSNAERIENVRYGSRQIIQQFKLLNHFFCGTGEFNLCNPSFERYLPPNASGLLVFLVLAFDFLTCSVPSDAPGC